MTEVRSAEFGARNKMSIPGLSFRIPNSAFRTRLPVCSWESKRSPKPLDRVRLLAPVLFADVARLRKASALPCSIGKGGIMLVRTPSSACVSKLSQPPSLWPHRPAGGLDSRWCSGSHWTLRRSRSWFESRSGYLRKCPASVPEARQPSKLQDEVRFLGGVFWFRLSSECGGCTRLCEGRRPGSIPGGDTC